MTPDRRPGQAPVRGQMQDSEADHGAEDGAVLDFHERLAARLAVQAVPAIDRVTVRIETGRPASDYMPTIELTGPQARCLAIEILQASRAVDIAAGRPLASVKIAKALNQGVSTSDAAREAHNAAWADRALDNPKP